MDAFPAALPHGPLTEAFPDVHVVTGTFRMGPGLVITRNMTVVRQGGELILINSVRLDEAGERALEALGKPTHLLRIGAFHGADDAYFAQRWGMTVWAPPGTEHGRGLTTKHELVAGSSPIEGARVFPFAHAKKPEVALVLANGVLVTCDSYQNWTTFEGCSLIGKGVAWAMGFGPTVIGGPWTKAMGTEVRRDFDALLDEPFVHLSSAHGTVLRDEAKAGLRNAVAARFGG